MSKIIKKSPTIIDLFKKQVQNNIKCPACDALVLKTKLNEHLDKFCKSLQKKTRFSTKKSGDLTPNSSKTKNCTNTSIILSEKVSKRSSVNQTKVSKTNKSTKNFEYQNIVNSSNSQIIDNDEIIILENSSNSYSQKVPNSQINEEIILENASNSYSHESWNSKNITKSIKSQINNDNEKLLTSSLNSSSQSFQDDDSSETIKSYDSYSDNLPNDVIIDDLSDAYLLTDVEKFLKICYDDEIDIDFQNDPLENELEINELNFHEININFQLLVRDDENLNLIKDKNFLSLIQDDENLCTLIQNDKDFNLLSQEDDFRSTSNTYPSLKRKKPGTDVNDEIRNVCTSFNIEQDSLILSPIKKDIKSKENDINKISSTKILPKTEDKLHLPYYIANFKYILKNVFNDEDNKKLFNEEDKSYIQAFESASDSSQKLYVRLFQRKYHWLRISKINYPEIADELNSFLEELVKIGLLDSGENQVELETALDLLSVTETKSLMKQYKLNSTNKAKPEMIQCLMKHCKEYKTVFFSKGGNYLAENMLKKVKQIISPCYRISLLPKRLFTRVLMLFSLPTISDDDDEAAGGQQQQLFTLLQVNKGELVFPAYTITKKTVIFQDRDELIRYEEARQLENDIYNAIEDKNFELGKELYLQAKKEFEAQSTCGFASRAISLPIFLKRYTSFHVYIRCMTQGVEILQKLRQYEEAVALLKELLNQKIYCQDYRGRWYDRLALNLEQHLKNPERALDAIVESLNDENVRVGPRHALLIRAQRIIKTVNKNEDLIAKILKDLDIIQAPKVIIQGRLFPRDIVGRRHVFISGSKSFDDDDDISVLNVENLALEHYKKNGFTEGIHGESSTFISIYALLFWYIIYDGNIPDVFISPFQTHPLDLNSNVFYSSRKNLISNRLETLRHSTIDEIQEIVKNTWLLNFGRTSLVTWDRFKDLEHVQGLLRCLGISILCGICERLAKDFRFTRSGMPDLVVWNPETNKAKIVEVKGPGDKLSSKQILWLDYLIKQGADAELCLVEAIGSKKLKKESSS